MELKSDFDSETKIWRGATSPRIFNKDCSIGRVASQMMQNKLADSVCQISDDEGISLTFGLARTYAIRIAQHLKRMGLTEKDIVGVVTPNCTYQMPVIVGCWMNCTPIHGVNGINEENVIKHCFDITKPKLIFCAGEFYEKVNRATSELNVKIYTLLNHIEGVSQVTELLEPTKTEFFYQPENLKHGGEQTMVINCSSGTTGLPKAIKYSNERLLIDVLFTSGDSPFFTFSTPDWASGLFSLIMNVLGGGKRIVTAKPYTPEYMLDIIQRYKIETLLTLPTQISDITLLPNCTKDALKSLRSLTVGGGHFALPVQERLRSKLSNTLVINGYGSSESGGISLSISANKPRSVGQIMPNVEMKIVDPETRMALGHDEVGEICARSVDKWTGYYHNEEATKATMDEDGWVHTGDMGYMDKENYLYIVDRCKDQLKYKGFHYMPFEIEEVIAQLPGVKDVCVFGVFSEEFSDSAAAAIVKHDGSTLNEADVINCVKEQNVFYKQLNAGVYFVDEIPRNNNGKVLRKKVKELCVGPPTYQNGN